MINLLFIMLVVIYFWNTWIVYPLKILIVFFHELSHAAHEKVKGSLKMGQDHFQEIVAELSAQALCTLVGKQATDTFGNSHRYIERYAEKAKLSPHAACLKVMSQTERVLSLILKGKEFGKEAVRKLAA